MTLLRPCGTVAAAVLAASLSVPAPAGAGLIQIEPMIRLTAHDAVGRALADGAMPRLRGEAVMPAGTALLRVEVPQGGVSQATACDGCTPGMVPSGAVTAEEPRRSATLSVNVAILLLGSLWLTLMVRRIQMRLGSNGLNGGARPHAAGGH